MSHEELTEIRKFNRNIDWLKKQSIKSTAQWVKAGVITKATGWNNEEMRTARDRKYVVHEKRVDGFWYDLKSVATNFLINNQSGIALTTPD